MKTVIAPSIATVKAQAAQLFAEGKNWNSVNALIRKAGLKVKEEVIEFGLHTNKTAQAEKEAFVAETPANEIRAHYYSYNITARRSRYNYNVLRAKRVILFA